MIAPADHTWFTEVSDEEKSEDWQRRAKNMAANLRRLMTSRRMSLDDLHSLLVDEAGDQLTSKTTLERCLGARNIPVVRVREEIAKIFGLPHHSALFDDPPTDTPVTTAAPANAFELGLADHLQMVAEAEEASDEQMEALASRLIRDPKRGPYVRMALLFFTRRRSALGG